jgi:hypothetical protein
VLSEERISFTVTNTGYLLLLLILLLLLLLLNIYYIIIIISFRNKNILSSVSSKLTIKSVRFTAALKS